MNELALFAGAGGGLLASKWMLGWRTICYVEIDPYCIEVLKKRISEGYLCDAPIWSDAKTFDGRPWNGKVNVISAGFPCQPFSVAGQQKAEQDERNMWPDTIRIIREVWPEWILLENVSGLLSHEYFGTILRDLAESGYDAVWKIISAAEVGAPHRRDRLWIVAHTNDNGLYKPKLRVNYENTREKSPRAKEIRESCKASKVADTEQYTKGSAHRVRVGRGIKGWQEQNISKGSEVGSNLADSSWWQTDPADLPYTDEKGLEGRNRERCEGRRNKQSSWSNKEKANWPVESRLGRVAHGMANRVDRLKSIGNGQVPAVAAVAWDLLNRKLKIYGDFS